MEESQYDPNSYNATISRVEATVLSFGGKLDKLVDYVIGVEERTRVLEQARAADQASAKTSKVWTATLAGIGGGAIAAGFTALLNRWFGK